MHLKRDNIEFITYDNFDEIIGLETQMRGNDFIFDCVYIPSYKCYKINFKWVGS